MGTHMTMHLLPPMYSTTGKKKGKKKFASAEHARKARELDESWKELLKRQATDYVDGVDAGQACLAKFS